MCAEILIVRKGFEELRSAEITAEALENHESGLSGTERSERCERFRVQANSTHQEDHARRPKPVVETNPRAGRQSP